MTYPHDGDRDGVADVCSLPRTRRAAAARQNALERLGVEREVRLQQLFLDECRNGPATLGEPKAEPEDECATGELLQIQIGDRHGIDSLFFSGPVITGPEYCLNRSFGGPVTYPHDGDRDGVADVCSLPRTRRAAAARQNALERLGEEQDERLRELFAEECTKVPATLGEPKAEPEDECAEFLEPAPPPPPSDPGIEGVEVPHSSLGQRELPPDAPQNVSLAEGDERIEVTWDAPASDGGGQVTGYEVRWRLLGNPWPDVPQAENVTGSPHVVLGLENGKRYHVQVRALNLHGSGEWSDPSAIAEPGTEPGMPRNLLLQESDRRLLASWDAPASDGGAQVTGFEVRWRLWGDTWPATPQAQGVTASQQLISNLDNGAFYEVQVRAVNRHGAGEWSDPPGSGVPSTQPGVPTSVSIAAGDRRIEVSWAEPTSDGGSLIFDYEVQYKKNSESRWSSPVSAGTDLAQSIAGLDNGEKYDVEVRAVNRNGRGGWSQEVSATPHVAAGQPQNVAVTERDQQITVTWMVPAGDAQMTVTGYDLQWKTASGQWDTPAGWKALGSTELSYVIGSESGEGLINGTTYHLRIRARNGPDDADAGDWSDPPVSATPGTAPDGPGSVILSEGDRRIEVSWFAPSSNGGGRVTSYEVQWRRVGESWPSTPQAEGLTGPPYVISVLENGESYEVQVRAVNRYGSGNWSDPPVSATPGTVPGVPGSVLLSEGDRRIEVSWFAPSSDGGAGVTGYEVRWRRVGESWPSTPQAESLARSPYVISGLANDDEYVVQVRAVNRHGEGEWSDAEQAIPRPLGRTPGVPRNVEVGSGNARLTVTWEAPIDDGGLSITRYKVQWKLRTGGWSRDSDVGEELAGGLEHTIFNLGDKSVYDVRVLAVNAQGEGPPSAAVSATAGIPGQVRNILAAPRNGQLNLSWDAPSDNGSGFLEYEDRFSPLATSYESGDTLFLYTIEWKQPGSARTIGSAKVLDPRYNIKAGVENGREYVVRIQASFVNRIDIANRIGFVNGYGPTSQVRGRPKIASPRQSDHNNLRTFVESVVRSREAQFPWLRTAWGHIRGETVEIVDFEPTTLGQVAYSCSSVTGQDLQFECGSISMHLDIDHREDVGVIIHELAHVYTLQTTLLPNLGPLGMAHLYFAEVYEGKEGRCAAEVFADVLLHVTMSGAELPYFHDEACTANIDEPTRADETVVLDLLAGNDPSWFVSFFDHDNDGDADPAEVWKSLMDIENLVDRRIVFAALADELGGYCSAHGAFDILIGRTTVESGYNPWRQDNTC
ncbi:MAG: fibronectin type III domain-containing protein [Acidimicrobiia bacterium]|nr:fibronectin type III domain-containing protein [Acidimicrobiia bacterium]